MNLIHGSQGKLWQRKRSWLGKEKRCEREYRYRESSIKHPLSIKPPPSNKPAPPPFQGKKVNKPHSLFSPPPLFILD